jgi:hypothetical protein
MEIKVAPVPNEIRFALQPHTAEPTQPGTGMPWVYVILLCGGCILITIAVFHIQEKRKQKDDPFLCFHSKIE